MNVSGTEGKEYEYRVVFGDDKDTGFVTATDTTVTLEHDYEPPSPDPGDMQSGRFEVTAQVIQDLESAADCAIIPYTQPPVASVDVTTITSKKIEVSAAQSYDPEGQELTYEWDLWIYGEYGVPLGRADANTVTASFELPAGAFRVFVFLSVKDPAEAYDVDARHVLVP
jgi:hypothetical protein